MLNKLVMENLKHRPVRTLLSVCAIAVEVTMILTQVGVSRGMLEDSQRRARGVGADVWVRPPNSSVLSFSSASMNEKLVEFFEKQAGVVLATGSVSHGIGGIEQITGIDLEKFSKMSGGFRYIAGGPFRNPDDILVDERYADIHKLSVGSKVKLVNREWNICGIIEPGKLARLLLPLPVVQEMAGATGRVSQIFVKVDQPANAQRVIDDLKQKLPDYKIYSIEEFTSLFSASNVPGLRAFNGVVITVSVLVGFLVVFLSMYTAVLERTREIGILKSLGASRGYVLSLMVRETFVLALIGTVIGILLTYGTRVLVNFYAGPSLTQVIVAEWWPIAAAIAIGGAILGTLYPAWKAVQQDALEALSYE
ncbi:MAG: ABC transporter permease [Acidimicrobiia bacterium]|nr:ABC transporter permease [Acidimicrobiia bacterium]